MSRIAVGLLVMLSLGACATNSSGNQDTAPGSTVQVVRQADGNFTLLRNGEPYQVKGAGTGVGQGQGVGRLGVLAASGGNSIRTWGTEQLEQVVDGKPLIDRAHELGISVIAGFWVQHVRHGFDYSDPERIESQRAELREAVLKYKDHPAVLVWGMGNEMEAFEPNVEGEVIWRELNHLAGIFKDLDTHHPVMTVISEAKPENIDGILKFYPNVDIHGVNS